MTAEILHARPTPAPSLRTHKIVLEDLSLDVDIGFHDFEIGRPQRLLISVWATIDLKYWPKSDCAEASWDYDFIRQSIHALAKGRHFNLQEVLARKIFQMIAARPGVTALSIFLRKPDVYPDAAAVGVWLSSE